MTFVKTLKINLNNSVLNESRTEKIKSLCQKYTNRIINDIYDSLSAPFGSLTKIEQLTNIKRKQLIDKVSKEFDKINKFCDTKLKNETDSILKEKYKKWAIDKKYKIQKEKEKEESKIVAWEKAEKSKNRTQINNNDFTYQAPFEGEDIDQISNGKFNIQSLTIHLIKDEKRPEESTQPLQHPFGIGTTETSNNTESNSEENEYVNTDEDEEDEEDEESESLNEWTGQPRTLPDWRSKMRSIYQEIHIEHQLNGNSEAWLGSQRKGVYNTHTGSYSITDHHGNTWIYDPLQLNI
jgi:CRISPR/Cas system-associated endoribonuclease Cas2